jgi:hypothetical protein
MKYSQLAAQLFTVRDSRDIDGLPELCALSAHESFQQHGVWPEVGEAKVAPIRYHFMNTQDQARVDRDCEEVFTIENDILSPRQQIRLHLRCLVREHKFGKLAWHLRGIRRALFLPDFADRNTHVAAHISACR